MSVGAGGYDRTIAVGRHRALPYLAFGAGALVSHPRCSRSRMALSANGMHSSQMTSEAHSSCSSHQTQRAAAVVPSVAGARGSRVGCGSSTEPKPNLSEGPNGLRERGSVGIVEYRVAQPNL